ncbi:unnamed protein product [Leptidea sinapis]|uniref:TIL domain-containing protein n=1 Tax=Leptidea sinapis TaxID=189913 RepID=A0A5E4PSF4_9NEOP|nr:unnamed protein product [Leptidea sinapis]
MFECYRRKDLLAESVCVAQRSGPVVAQRTQGKDEDTSDDGVVRDSRRGIRECEVGTRAYTTGCSKLKPEPSCEDPNPPELPGNICDFSACYCEPPTLRNKLTKECVAPEKCPSPNQPEPKKKHY